MPDRSASGPARSANSPRAGGRLLVLGAVAVALALVALAWLLWLLSSGTDREGLQTTVTVPGAFLLSRRQSSIVSVLIAIPGCLLVVGAVLLFLGVFLRRAARFGVRDRRWWQGGTVVSVMKPIGARAHLLWIAVAVVGWGCLILIPLATSGGGGWPLDLREPESTNTFIVLGLYGGLAAALAGILTVSLVKKLTYAAELRRRGDRARGGGAGKSFWRWFTFRWRFDLWFAAVGGALLGTSWMALLFHDTSFFAGALIIGAVFMAVAVVTAMQYWRAGQALGTGESFA
ncbi:MAG TPA: hypothetical protein VGC18_16045 [Lacisediminihabitans sp.]|uniref:hypothetical protein n=1 Tax=Lacisediminihabitans sp. TaxID=2787631 RepID=UPI002ED9DD82